jgi:uncharacterized membrane protein
MFAEVDPPPFVHVSRPNRSLGPVARRRALGAIAVTTLGIAAGASAFGAWPVMPFAGLEVALLALAFRLLGSHDADFERLEIGEHEVRVEAREAATHTRFVARRPWAQVVMRERGARCTVGLAYAGRTEPLGRMLSDEGRRQLADSLRGRLPVTAA